MMVVNYTILLFKIYFPLKAFFIKCLVRILLNKMVSVNVKTDTSLKIPCPYSFTLLCQLNFGQVFSTVVFLINHMPSLSLNFVSPFEKLFVLLLMYFTQKYLDALVILY